MRARRRLGVLASTYALTQLFFAPLLGALSDRVGRRPAGWMLFASFGGVAGPAIQSLVAGAVPPEDQGKVQGGITSLMSLTSIRTPLIFTAGLFSYLTSPSALIKLPSAPFLLGAGSCTRWRCGRG